MPSKFCLISNSFSKCFLVEWRKSGLTAIGCTCLCGRWECYLSCWTPVVGELETENEPHFFMVFSLFLLNEQFPFICVSTLQQNFQVGCYFGIYNNTPIQVWLFKVFYCFVDRIQNKFTSTFQQLCANLMAQSSHEPDLTDQLNWVYGLFGLLEYCKTAGVHCWCIWP